MPITTDLNINPYYDDYSEDNNYYKVLFRPSVPVQTRELNNLQSMLQKQIERFGDNIFEKGTIVEGCNFSFYPDYAYTKILDNDLDGVLVDVTLLKNNFAVNQDGVTAYISDAIDGYEASTPDLKTIYLTYRNSGPTNNTGSFSASDILTIKDANCSLHSITVTAGGSNFSNSDSVIICPALLINVTSGTLSNGSYIGQTNTGSNVQVVAIDSNTYATANQLLVYIKPRTTELTNASSNSVMWEFQLGTFQTSDNTVIGNVNRIFGAGAEAEVITNGIGGVISVPITRAGADYVFAPTAYIRSANNSGGIGALSLTVRNYLNQVRVSSSISAVGNGYGFGVGQGVIYQKGYFERVEPQVVIVEKYNSSPNAVCVGFSTVEEIITPELDSNLKSNATGTENENAPGAHRLKLTPTLTVMDVADARANTDFLPICEWNDGNPVKQVQTTTYSRIGDAMAAGIYDSYGDFVIDPFMVTTASTSNATNEGSTYSIVVDAGTAYVKGRKTQTNFNYRIDIPKGTDTKVSNTQSISLNYDAFLQVKEVGGVFQFSTGDTIDFYDTAKGFLSNVALVTAGNTTPQGTKIGTARIRSMTLNSGNHGDNTAVYNLYLFNVSMSSGQNFRNVRSVYYNGSTYKGIADVVLSYDLTLNSNIAKVQSIENDQLVFRTGFESIRNSNNTIYVYRTIDQTASMANTGTLTKSIAGTPNEFYPYSGNLSSSQLRDLMLIPLSNNLVQYTPLTGNVSVNTTSANVVGSGTTFLADVVAGDYIYLYPNNTSYDIKKVVNVVNNTLIIVDSNVSFANTTNNYKRVFPKNVPVPFGSRTGLSANVDANGNILTLNLGFSIDQASPVTCALGVNIQRSGVTSTTKTANRNQLVQLRLANNAAGTTGPWCLGVSDVFRLRGVYTATSSTVNTNSINVTSEFYIDSQQGSNYSDLAYLVKKPKSPLNLTSSDYLLVQFDYFTRSGAGYFDTVSYLHTANASQIANLEATPLANLTSAASSFEVPEVYTGKGDYYDLLGCVDFRPAVANTVAPTTNSSTAPVNPVYTLSFGNTANPSNDLKFPLPNSLLSSTFEYYMGRMDSVVMGSDGNIVVLRGTAALDPKARHEPNIPKDSLKLQTIAVPPYPNFPKNPSNQAIQIVSTGAYTERDTSARLGRHLLTPTINVNQLKFAQPQRYTAADIGRLERRIQVLEYYQALSLLETSITQKIIPSSIDGSLNRFKYGFFVDDFNSYLYSDRKNPQFAASIEIATINEDTAAVTATGNLAMLSTNMLVPPKFEWQLQHVCPGFHQSFIDFEIVNQDKATIHIPQINAVAQTVSAVAQANAFYFDGIDLWPENTNFSANLRFSSISGNAVLYFELLDDPAIYIMQGNTVLIDSASAVNLTSAEKTKLANDPYTARAFGYLNQVSPDQSGALNQVLRTSPPIVDPVTGRITGYQHPEWIYGLGKIEFSHNPALGRDYRIKLTGAPSDRGNHTQCWYALVYPIDVNQTLKIATYVTPGSNAPTIFSGTMKFTVGGNPTKIGNQQYQYDRLVFTCTGLKPLTVHQLFIDGIQNTGNIIPMGGALGGTLTSDASGMISFAYVFDDSWVNKVANAKTADDNPIIGKTSARDFYYQVLGGGGDNRGGHRLWTSGFSIDYSFIPSYSLFELVGVNTYCNVNVPVRNPNQITNF